jgi:flagellar motility protein MotE (MotC chaperone)
MRPRDAATIFNGLDKPVLLEILDRMKPAKASPVIALMEPESARQATADLAGKRARATTLTN